MRPFFLGLLFFASCASAQIFGFIAVQNGAPAAPSSPPSAPTNVQVVLQGETGPAVAQMVGSPPYNTNLSSNLNEIAWTCSAGATSDEIWRSADGGAYSLLATISDSSAQTAYSSFVSGQGSYAYPPGLSCAYTDNSATNIVTGDISHPKDTAFNLTGSVSNGSTTLTVTSVVSGTPSTQGIGGPGIPQGDTLSSCSISGGTGTCTLAVAATSSSNGAYGTLYFPNHTYLYEVKAINSGGTSAASSPAYLPYIVNGGWFLAGGLFNGTVTTGQTAPATTPLGYSKAMKWTANNTDSSLINPAVGQNAAANNLSTGGYTHFVISLYPQTSGLDMQMLPELAGDQDVSSTGAQQWSALGCPSPLTVNAWNTCTVSMDTYYADVVGGTNVKQTSFYKNTLQVSDPTLCASNCIIWAEMSFQP